MSLEGKFIVVGTGGQVRTFDPLTNTFSEAKTSGTTRDLYCVHGDASGNVVFAGGRYGTLIKSLDGGETWESVIGLPDTINDYVMTLLVVNANDVYIGMKYRYIYHYNGDTVSLLHDFAAEVLVYDLFGNHNEILISNQHTDSFWGLHYLLPGGSVTEDETVNNNSSYRSVAGVKINDSQSVICYFGGFITVAVGSPNSWSEKESFLDNDFNQTPSMAHNPTTGFTYLYAYGSSSHVGSLRTRTAPEEWGFNNLGYETGAARIACLDSSDTVVLIPKKSVTGDGSVIIWNGVSATQYLVGASYTGQFIAAFSPPSQSDSESTRETSFIDGESYGRLIQNGDLVLDDKGHVYRDYSPESRCTFRLMCRRGEYWVDPTIGSRLHTIKTLKDAKRKVKAYVDEALKPLIDEGTIDNVSIGEYVENVDTGMLAVQILIDVPSKTQSIDLGLIPLGGL